MIQLFKLMNQKSGIFFEQIIPMSLTVVVFAALSAMIYYVIFALNLLPIADKVILKLRFSDIMVGAIIYLKTSVDFAIFMGRLMAQNPGWKNRIAIEIGTALGNGLGTISVLIVWVFFKEVEILLALMIFLAALVLFELAHASLEHFGVWEGTPGFKREAYKSLNNFLHLLLKFSRPVTSRVLPDLGKKLGAQESFPWRGLLYFSFTVPFILGLDDFAGYVPLFNVVNVFGFSVGVVGAHMILNIALFISPQKTVMAVRNEWVSFLGTLAFLGLGIWGIVEVIKIFTN